MLDVREPFEWDLASLPGSIQMPMNSLQIELIPKEAKGVVLCHHGMRSMYVLKHLQAHGFSNLLNVAGGIDAWSREVDDAIPRY